MDTTRLAEVTGVRPRPWQDPWKTKFSKWSCRGSYCDSEIFDGLFNFL